MALFKFRWPGQKEERDTSPVRRSRAAQSESVDDMRRRARHRLIGAVVLVALGVVGFPMLFDTQPRHVPVDVPIEIPDRNQVAPLVVPGNPAKTEDSLGATAARGQSASSAVDGALDDGEEVVSIAPPAPIAVPQPPEPPQLVQPPVAAPVAAASAVKPLVADENKPESKPEPKPRPEVKPVTPEPKPAKPEIDEAARARALLEGRPLPTPAAAEVAKQGGRFIVQVGAFAELTKANEVRSKLERAGLKTYTQVVDTKDGKRTRVRVGPFDGRDDADKAAARIKTLGLPASVLTL